MGTYTTNKNLFMPTVGEQGWGELVNNNFSTIDTFLKPITVSGSTYTFSGNHVGNQSGGSVSATSITNSGTLTNTGKITANGGIGTKALTATTGTFSGAVTGTSFNGVTIKKVITVTPNDNYSPDYSYSSHAGVDETIILLPPIYGHVYTGTFRFYNTSTGNATIAYRRFNSAWENKNLSINASSFANITLSNADMLMVMENDSLSYKISPCCYTLS